MRYQYFVSGIHLCANRAVPGLIALRRACKSEVKVYLGLMPSWIEGEDKDKEPWYVSPSCCQNGVPGLRVWKLVDGSYFRFRYCDGPEFLVDRQGTQIWATWPDQLTLEDTAIYLLGPVLGFVLRLRGVTCLHASAIAVDDKAIALVGPAGAGKSTTAAAFARLGYPVLSDDVVALADQESCVLVQPAYPCLRLWPESVDALYGTADALPPLTPNWDKRRLDLTKRGYHFQDQPLALAAVYVLSERSEHLVTPCFEAIPARTAVLMLVANSYVNYLLDEVMRAQEFAVLTHLVESAPVGKVTPQEDPSQLSELCYGILDDFRAPHEPLP